MHPPSPSLGRGWLRMDTKLRERDAHDLLAPLLVLLELFELLISLSYGIIDY